MHPVISNDEFFITTSDQTTIFEMTPFKIAPLPEKEKEKYKDTGTNTHIQPTLLLNKMDIPNMVNCLK